MKQRDVMFNGKIYRLVLHGDRLYVDVPHVLRHHAAPLMKLLSGLEPEDMSWLFAEQDMLCIELDTIN